VSRTSPLVIRPFNRLRISLRVIVMKEAFNRPLS
jgi:hypothetical protein